GSNISYFDGEKLHEGIHGLGYIFDDEGAGTSLGKRLITDFLYGNMPQELADKFSKEFDVNKENVIKNLYQRPLPNFYLASHNAFLANNLEHPYCYEIVVKELESYIVSHIYPYHNYPNIDCHFVGPIAYNFRDVLTELCA